MLKTKFLVSKNIINFAQTLECGQIFSYEKLSEKEDFVIYSGNECAFVFENLKENVYEIFASDEEYFKNFLDLQTDYEKIKNNLKEHKILTQPIKFGDGIRILRQDVLEIIISFAISANNRIPRIMSSVASLRSKFGDMRIFENVNEELKNHLCLLQKSYINFQIEENNIKIKTFPSLNKLSSMSEADFLNLSVGYRAKQLVKLCCQLGNIDFQNLKNLSTDELSKCLVDLSGVGPKVADCILLFAFARRDVFPVDTWIEKVYKTFYEKDYGKCKNRLEIRKKLVLIFGNNSGFAQQYLFYYARSLNLNYKK